MSCNKCRFRNTPTQNDAENSWIVEKKYDSSDRISSFQLEYELNFAKQKTKVNHRWIH